MRRTHRFRKLIDRQWKCISRRRTTRGKEKQQHIHSLQCKCNKYSIHSSSSSRSLSHQSKGIIASHAPKIFIFISSFFLWPIFVCLAGEPLPICDETRNSILQWHFSWSHCCCCFFNFTWARHTFLGLLICWDKKKLDFLLRYKLKVHLARLSCVIPTEKQQRSKMATWTLFCVCLFETCNS